MKLKDVKKPNTTERKTVRANMRLFPSQKDYIVKNNLSIQKIFDSALVELGYNKSH